MASGRLGPLVAANAERYVTAGRYADDARRRVRARVELAAALAAIEQVEAAVDPMSGAPDPVLAVRETVAAFRRQQAPGGAR